MTVAKATKPIQNDAGREAPANKPLTDAEALDALRRGQNPYLGRTFELPCPELPDGPYPTGEGRHTLTSAYKNAARLDIAARRLAQQRAKENEMLESYHRSETAGVTNTTIDDTSEF